MNELMEINDLKHELLEMKTMIRNLAKGEQLVKELEKRSICSTWE